MLTGFLTTGDFVRLTNRSPFPSLMSFEHFTTIWPAVLEPQREWSMMETPYKKKINQTHLNSNIVREWTLLWMRNAKDNTFDTEGSWWTYIMSFYGGKNYSPFHSPPPSVITRPLTPLPLPFSYFLFFLFGFAVLLFTLCVVCLMSDSASLSWQRPAVKVGVIFLLVTAVKGHTHTHSKSHCPTLDLFLERLHN